MTTLLLIPFLAYSLNALRNARRREQKLWAVLEAVADRVDDVSYEVGLLPRTDHVPLDAAAEECAAMTEDATVIHRSLCCGWSAAAATDRRGAGSDGPRLAVQSM